MEYQKKCGNCGNEFVSKSKIAKWCKKSCGQRAYEKRQGIEKPKFLKAYSESVKVPTGLGVTYQSVNHSNDVELNKLLAHKQYLINSFISISKKEIKYQRVGAALGIVMGITLSKNITSKTNDSLLLHLAVGGIFAYTGSVIGKQYGQVDSKEKLKLESIKNQLESLTNKITAAEVAAASLQKFEQLNKRKLATSVTGQELANMKFESYRVHGKYADLLGDISRGFNMAIYGAAGSGKSSVAIDLATNLKEHGKVLYFATEEGISKTLSRKIRTYKANSPYITFSKTRNWAEMKKEIKDYQYVVIDSIERVNDITPDELDNLYKRFPHVSFISILQCNKDGSYKGDSKYIHDVDMDWKVKNMTVTNETKNRFGGSGTVILEEKRQLLGARIRKI